MTDTNEQHGLLDTHQHLVFPGRFRYSWTEGLPALEGRPFTLEDYRSDAGAKAVSDSVFMETGVDDDYWQDETRYALSLAERAENRIAGVVAGCRPEHGAALFDEWLDELESSRVIGYRRILHTEPDELSATDRFVRNVREIGDRGKTFDLCFLERQLPCAVALAKRCDNTQLILDHCGVPDIAGGNFAKWQDDMQQLAALPHVSCKLSGLVAYCPADRDTESAVLPYLEHCANSFGADRLVWGSDWPVCNMTSGLSEWVSIFRKFIAGESADTGHAVQSGNAKRIYGIRN